MSAGLVLDDVSIRLGGRELLRLTAAVGPSEVLTVTGPSGSGKSTLLALIAGVLPAAFSASGRVTLGGAVLDGLPPERRHVGLMFQDDLLFPHLSVGRNLMFAIPPGDRATRRAAAEAALDEVELSGTFDRDPATLSGGQRQRVALMRVMLAQPRALLLDEPFSRLDRALRAATRDAVFTAARARGLPVLLVTHDPEDAQAAGGAAVSLG